MDCKADTGQYEKTGKIHVVEGGLNITQDDNLVSFKIEDNCYVNNKFIGTTVSKKITVNVLNPNNEIDLENKEITAQTGMIIDEIEETVPFGNYIISKPDTEEVKEKTSFVGYDYMIKFNIPYKNQVNYPISAGDLFEDVCNQAGVTVGNSNFVNSNYMILGNPFTNNEDCRTVLSNIAQLAGGFAKIGRDNKAYIISLKNISNLLKVKDVNSMTVKELNLTIVKMLSGEKDNADERIDGNNYLDDFSKNNIWGEVNSLILRITGTEGENTTIQDETSIQKNGLTELVIEDNYFLTDETERQKVITPLWKVLKGIKYLPFKTTYYGYPYLDTGDLIYIQDTKDKGYISYVFNHTFTFNGGYSGTIETTAMTKTQTAYKNTINSKTKFRQVERKIDKINGVIEDIIEEQTETGNKLTQVEQTIDGITQTVSSVETKVEQVENKADNAQTTADNANQNAQNAQQTANNATNQITTTNQKVSQIEQTVNNITQSVTEVEEKIETVEETANTANSTANQAKSTAETANNTANTAKNTADTVSDNLEANYFTKTETSSEIEQKANSITQEVTETVENIQIGGTNLIKDSAPYELNNEIWQKTSSKVSLNIIDETSAPSLKAFNIGATGTITDNLTGIYSIPTCNVLQKDKEYCYSMWLKASENCTITVGYPRGGRTNLNVTTNWTRHTFKFKATEPTASSHGFGIYLPQNANTSFKLYAHSIKLEEGNKITAWSPAPEDDVKGYELGTRIEQNVDAVKLAWNQISEYIQMMILNGNASLAILDSSNNVIMSLDKEGQNFYKSGQTTPFGEMGIKKVNNQNYISFSVLGEYGQSLQDGMAWGITLKNDNKFIPILYIKDFQIGDQGSETGTGKLVLSSCDIVLDAMGGGIEADGIKIHGDALPGLWFDDVDSEKTLLCIKPDMGSISYATISILDTIKFYKNQTGSNSFRIGNDNSKYCLMTDDGSFQANSIYMTGNNDGNTINLSGQVTFGNLPTYQGNKLVYGTSGHTYFMEWTGKLDFWVDTTNVGTLSDKRLKTEIKDIDEDFIKAIEEIEMKQFKVANRNGLISFGILAQDLIEIFKRYNKNPFDYEIVYETRYRTDDDTIYYAIDYTQFLILKQKAMDMKLKKLEEENKAKDKLLQELISRIEKIEGGNK